jgi:hypothetical protein
VARNIINFVIGIVLLFVANTIILALSPSMASVERGYVSTTARWGAQLRGQATSVGGLAPTSTVLPARTVVVLAA